MSNDAQRAKHFRILQGMCIFLFFVTLLLMELSFVGLMDAEASIREFRQAIPRTVIFPMGVGVLLGHWFHPGDYDNMVFLQIEGASAPRWVGPVVLAIIAAIFIAVGMGCYFASGVDFYFPGWTMFLTGLALGCLFWAV